MADQRESSSHDEAIRYVRSLMCSPLGAKIVEEQIIGPFGYVRHAQVARQEERCPRCGGRGWIPATVCHD